MCSRKKGKFFFLSLIDQEKVEPVQSLHFKLRQILNINICYCKKCNNLPTLATWNAKWNQLSTFYAQKDQVYNGWKADDPSNMKETSLSSLYLYCKLSAHSNDLHPGYCDVCKLRFDDYLVHCKSKLHKQVIYFNEFNQHIKTMCSVIRKMIKIKKPNKRKGQFAKSNGWNRRYRFVRTNPIYNRLNKSK